MQILFLIGRILLGGYFLYNGIGHFKGLTGMVGYSKSKGVPLAKAAVVISGVILTLGGLTIIANRYAILGMVALVVCLVPITFMMHRFWKESDPMVRMGEKINFTKNLALIGALILLVSIG
jgi:putative oxidoreductase